MPFPATLTLVTVGIQCDIPPGGAATGWFDFTMVRPLLGASDNAIVPPFTLRATLATDGSSSIQLPATNDPQWSPTGWTYTVEGRVGGATITGTLQLDYQTASVQLADLLQVDGAAVTGTSYILTSQRSVASGVAGLDADGDVINAAGEKVGEAAGGGIPESIIDAKGDLIAGTAANTAARLAVGTNGQYLTAASGQTTGLQWDTFTATDISDSTSVGRAVVTAANAAAGRTAIDAEATGVAAALVDDLSGVSNASTARTNLGLGGAAVLAVGTSAGTVAAGDHNHTGVYQPLDGDLTTIAGLTATSDNMIQSVAGAWASRTPAQVKSALAVGISDVASLQTTLDGKTDESLLTTKGDLYVATASATLARVGVGSNNQVLTADSAETAGVKWATPSGGGGSSITIASGYATAGDVTPQTTASWAVMTSTPTFAIAAVAGDVVSIDWTGLIDPVSNMFLDLAVIVSGAVTKYAATGTSSNGVEGDPGLYPDVPAFFPTRGLGMVVTCASGDLSGGNITFGFAVINPGGGGKLYASTNYPLRWRIVNYGQ